MRKAIVEVYVSFLEDLLTGGVGATGDYLRYTFEGIPKDAKILDVVTDRVRGVVQILLESEGFEEMRPGAAPPVIDAGITMWSPTEEEIQAWN